MNVRCHLFFITVVSNAYIIAGSIAIPLLLFVLYTFVRFKRTRSHPAPMMFARTLADTGFIFSTLFLSAVVDDNELRNASAICSNWGPLIGFFCMASQFYFVGMCYGSSSSLCRGLLIILSIDQCLDFPNRFVHYLYFSTAICQLYRCQSTHLQLVPLCCHHHDICHYQCIGLQS